MGQGASKAVAIAARNPGPVGLGVALLVGTGLVIWHLARDKDPGTTTTPPPTPPPTFSPSGPRIIKVEGEEEASYECPILK